jgi:hypothetical protein
MTISFPEIDAADVQWHITMLHERALRRPGTDGGKLIVAGYGEDPNAIHPKTGKPGLPLPPIVGQFAIGEVSAMVDFALRLSLQPHRNIYAPWCIMRHDLERDRKGGEADIIDKGVLALIADFDDEEAHRWRSRLPLPPNYVLKTSVARWQAFYLLDRPASVAEVKPIGLRLRDYTKSDSGALDISHVWRIAGLLNWPNAKKISEGRSPEPVRVTLEKLE